ncbi:hypothetical protein EDC04DRAFT_2712334 [Pisolithus marmoratus]|nr:hypothetical protein EDC04DRAFT_2712334 [Pisolithus marmoratus]
MICNPLMKMQLMKTIILVALATYVRADCAVCPQQVDSQPLVSNCYIDDDTFCTYNDGNSDGTVCVYTSEGWLASIFTTACPSTVGSTTDCTSC